MCVEITQQVVANKPIATPLCLLNTHSKREGNTAINFPVLGPWEREGGSKHFRIKAGFNRPSP